MIAHPTDPHKRYSPLDKVAVNIYAQFSAFSLEPLILFSQEEEDDRLVIDKTGLIGKYDYEFKWARSPRTMARPGTTSIPQPPSEEEGRAQLPRALEEQFGIEACTGQRSA